MREMVVCILLLSSLVRAEDSNGGQAGALLRMGVGARPMAYGGAHSAIADDAYGLFYNPAGLVKLKTFQLGSQLAFLPGDRTMSVLSLARPVKFSWGGEHYYGLGWTRLSLGSQIERRIKNTPEPIGLWRDTQDLFVVSTAHWLRERRMGFGVSFKFLNHVLGEADAQGYGFDLGAVYRASKYVDIATVAQDVYTKLGWSTGFNEKAPLRARLAGVVRLAENRLGITSEVEFVQNQGLAPRVGMEWWLFPDSAALRAGYNDGRWTTGLGIGIGLGSRWAMALDYAFSTEKAFDDAYTHRVSMTLLSLSTQPVADEGDDPLVARTSDGEN